MQCINPRRDRLSICKHAVGHLDFASPFKAETVEVWEQSVGQAVLQHSRSHPSALCMWDM